MYISAYYTYKIAQMMFVLRTHSVIPAQEHNTKLYALHDDVVLMYMTWWGAQLYSTRYIAALERSLIYSLIR